jgi:hypothetical protein
MIATFMFSSASSQQTWTPDRDLVLTGAMNGGSAAFLFSTDPSLTTTTVSTPTAKQVIYDVIVWMPATTGNGLMQMRVPISAGKTYYAANGSAALTVLLYFDEITADLTAT